MVQPKQASNLHQIVIIPITIFPYNPEIEVYFFGQQGPDT
jgi:hypothetical protein